MLRRNVLPAAAIPRRAPAATAGLRPGPGARREGGDAADARRARERAAGATGHGARSGGDSIRTRAARGIVRRGAWRLRWRAEVPHAGESHAPGPLLPAHRRRASA